MSVLIRAGRPEDASELGYILWQFQQLNDWMPKLHARGECDNFCAQLVGRGWVVVAQAQEEPVGFLALDEDEVCALYLRSDWHRAGIGARLLATAKQGREYLWLKCFQANTGAQAFYLSQGFAETERSDGHENDEKLPDVTYIWTKDQAR